MVVAFFSLPDLIVLNHFRLIKQMISFDITFDGERKVNSKKINTTGNAGIENSTEEELTQVHRVRNVDHELTDPMLSFASLLLHLHPHLIQRQRKKERSIVCERLRLRLHLHLHFICRCVSLFFFCFRSIAQIDWFQPVLLQ